MLHRGTLNNSCRGWSQGVCAKGEDGFPRLPPPVGSMEAAWWSDRPGMADWLSGTGHGCCHTGMDEVWCCCGSWWWAGEGLRGWCIHRLPLALVPSHQLCAFSWEWGWNGLLDLCWTSLPMAMPVLVRLGSSPLWDPNRCSPILCQQQRICLQKNRCRGLNCPLLSGFKGRERGCLFPGMKQATSAQSPAPTSLWGNDPLPGDRATPRHPEVPYTDH